MLQTLKITCKTILPFSDYKSSDKAVDKERTWKVVKNWLE